MFRITLTLSPHLPHAPTPAQLSLPTPPTGYKLLVTDVHRLKADFLKFKVLESETVNLISKLHVCFDYVNIFLY